MPRKMFFVPAALALLAFGCNLPSIYRNFLPTTSVRIRSATVLATAEPAAPSPTPVSPILEAPIQAIQVTDIDGSHPAAITPAQVGELVSRANEIFAPAGIRFTFDPRNFVAEHSTVLNHILNDPQARTAGEDAGTANRVAAGYPGKIVVLFRWGSGTEPSTISLSSDTDNFIVMTGMDQLDCGRPPLNVLAHEIGHYLGLPHTFIGKFNSLTAAEGFLRDWGDDPKVFDGDGFSDTPPDPLIDTAEYRCTPPDVLILNGLQFVLPRDNVMSYYNGGNKLSRLQIERARLYLSERLANGMALPSNTTAINPIEAQKLTVVEMTDCNAASQPRPQWGARRWLNDDDLTLSGKPTCSVTFRLPVEKAGRYRLVLYLSYDTNFAQIQASVDGSPAGGPIDLYGPAEMPTGAIPLGSFDFNGGTHTLNFKVIGKNVNSSGVAFGVDCITLTPEP